MEKSIFKKYEKMEKDYSINLFNIQEYMNSYMVLTEKIHGANFSFVYDGMDYYVAKRSGKIMEDENFYGNSWKEIREKYMDNFKKLVFYLKENFGDEIEYVQLFGELFGGRYIINGEIVEEGTPIQKEILYIPHNDFLVYDLRINDKYLSWSNFEDIINEFGFKTVPILEIMSLEDALKYNIEGKLTTVPRMYGLPNIENNIWEGVVIRGYWKDYYLPNGKRLIIKRKTEKFIEKKKVKNNKNFNPNKNKYLMEAISYWNLNRWNAYFSKHGEDYIKMENIKDITNNIVNDILQDLLDENPEIKNLSAKEYKKLKGQLFGILISQIKKMIYNRKFSFEEEKDFSNFLKENNS